jgi:hypothetical protein
MAVTMKRMSYGAVSELHIVITQTTTLFIICAVGLFGGP